MSQMGFFDLTNRYAGLDAKNDPLLTLDKVVPWESFRIRLEAVWRKPDVERKSSTGRKPLDAVMMFKAIMLCSVYSLSDDQVEYLIRDRPFLNRKALQWRHFTPLQSENLTASVDY